MNRLLSAGHVFVVPTFHVALELHKAEYDDDQNIVAVEPDAKSGSKKRNKRSAEEVARIIANTTKLLLTWGMPEASDYDGAEPIELLQSFNSEVQDAIDTVGGHKIFPKGYTPAPVVVPQKSVDVSTNMPVGAALKLTALINEYDRQVVKDVFQLRTYITNRLIEISGCGSTKEELRALELLGKISDVGLFVEKSEINVTLTSPAQLEHAIKEKINRILGRENIEIDEAEFEEEVEENEVEEEETLEDAEDEE
jgi:hypothetical protein